MFRSLFGKKKEAFNPLLFLMALGAGGIAVTPFAFMNYVVEHPKWLISLGHILPLLDGPMSWLYYSFLAIMIIFGIIHVITMIGVMISYIKWLPTNDAQSYRDDPIRNPWMTAPILAFAMTMNVMIGVVRFFFPILSDNLQSLMLPALVVWIVLRILAMISTISLTKNSFVQSFELEKMTFWRLLIPFTIGMVTVVGAGIAALAKDSIVANTAAFLTIISLTWGLFLFVTKLITLFQKHFADKNGLPSKYAMPGFLTVIPNITLYSISLFRLAHYFWNQTGTHVEFFLFAVIVGWFAFQTRYFMFGLSVLKDFLINDFFKQEYYATLRGFVCPLVAYAVLGSFAYQQFFANPIIYRIDIAALAWAIIMFGFIGYKLMWCRKGTITCE